MTCSEIGFHDHERDQENTRAWNENSSPDNTEFQSWSLDKREARELENVAGRMLGFFKHVVMSFGSVCAPCQTLRPIYQQVVGRSASPSLSGPVTVHSKYLSARAFVRPLSSTHQQWLVAAYNLEELFFERLCVSGQVYPFRLDQISEFPHEDQIFIDGLSWRSVFALIRVRRSRMIRLNATVDNGLINQIFQRSEDPKPYN